MRALRKIGYVFDRQNGSHMVLRQTVPPYRRLVVPDHKEIAKGTLRAIIRQAGLTVDSFAPWSSGSMEFSITRAG
jgi:predicted RNA binding protein YcfA (HicA-like mRNA interferase family)